METPANAFSIAAAEEEQTSSNGWPIQARRRLEWNIESRVHPYVDHSNLGVASFAHFAKDRIIQSPAPPRAAFAFRPCAQYLPAPAQQARKRSRHRDPQQ